MKISIQMKKKSGLILGIIAGCLLPEILLAQNNRELVPGDPYIYTGPKGNTVNPRSSGRFGSIQQVGLEIIRFIEVILVPFVMALALLVFLWGIVHYIRKGGDPAEREQGRAFMIWGVIGLAVMASVWGLVRILTNTIGVPLGIPSLNPLR